MFGADAKFGERSRDSLREARAAGALIACDIVWAEVAAAFGSRGETGEALNKLGVDFSPIDMITAVDAGASWRAYRARGGRRERIVADFLIAAHAAMKADRLLTRDRGLGATKMSGLVVVDPSK